MQPLVNLLEAFDQDKGPVFLDHVHANARGCRQVAQAVWSAIRPLLEESASRR
jgi:lysophospholipase L1-like esterase